MAKIKSSKEQARYAKFDRVATWIEAGLWAGLLVLGSLLALSALDSTKQQPTTAIRTASPPPAPADSLFEMEDLDIVDRSGRFEFWLQPTGSFASGRWSGDSQMLAVKPELGDWIELTLPPVAAAATGHDLTLYLTRAPDYGVVSYELNGTPLEATTDLWSEQDVVPTGAVELGAVSLQDGPNTLRITVTGTNPRSHPPHYQFGVDGLQLTARQ